MTLSTALITYLESKYGYQSSLWYQVKKEESVIKNYCNNIGISYGRILSKKFFSSLFTAITCRQPVIIILHTGRAIIPWHITVLRSIFQKRISLLAHLHGSSNLDLPSLSDWKHIHLKRFKYTDGVIVPSENEKKFQIKLGLSKGKVFNIHNFVPETSMISPSLKTTTPACEKPIILFCGILNKKKGLFELLDAFEAVLTQFPTATLLIAGTGPMCELAKNSAQKYGSHVIFLGHVKDIYALMKNADIFVAPSHAESYGRTVLEAAFSHTPMAISQIDPWQTWFKSDVDCQMFPVADATEIAKSIISILSDSKQSELMAKNAYISAKKISSEEAVIRDIQSIYEHLNKAHT